MRKYDQIIHLDRPYDPKHTPMSLNNRAAQFASFDALTGFGGRISETSRLTDRQIELSEDSRQAINERLLLLEASLKEHPEITVTYFVPDKTKSGGSYETVTGPVLKIDTYSKRLLLENNISIDFDTIIEI